MPKNRLVSGFLVAAVLAAAPSIAQTRTERTFDDWIVTCVETKEDKRCALSHTARDANGKRATHSWTLTQAADQSIKAVVLTPNRVLLAEGLKVTVGTGAPVSVPYRYCGPRACVVELPFSDTWLNAFRTRNSVQATFTTVAGRDVTLTVPLTGFSRAYDFFIAEQ